MSLAALRIAFFTECYHPIVNGIVAAVDGLAEAMRARGHSVAMFTPRFPATTGGGEETQIYRMPSLPLPMPTEYRLTLPVVAKRNRLGVLSRCSLIHTHSPFITGWMGAHYARRFGVPLVFTYHTRLDRYAHYAPIDPEVARRLAAMLTRTYANAAAAVTVPTRDIEQQLRSVGVRTRIEVIPSGIALGAFARARASERGRARLGSGSGPCLLTVSRLAQEKNLGLLLEMLAGLPEDTTLTFAGDGPERERLQATARARGLGGRARFLGEVAREELPELYASADVFVFSSTSETQGLVLVEAMAAGLPIVAADAPQTREVTAGDAYLCPANPQAMAAGVAKIVREPAFAQRLRASGRRAAEPYDLPRIAERMERLYRELRREPLAPAG